MKDWKNTYYAVLWRKTIYSIRFQNIMNLKWKPYAKGVFVFRLFKRIWNEKVKELDEENNNDDIMDLENEKNIDDVTLLLILHNSTKFVKNENEKPTTTTKTIIALFCLHSILEAFKINTTTNFLFNRSITFCILLCCWKYGDPNWSLLQRIQKTNIEQEYVLNVSSLTRNVEFVFTYVHRYLKHSLNILLFLEIIIFFFYIQQMELYYSILNFNFILEKKNKNNPNYVIRMFFRK